MKAVMYTPANRAEWLNLRHQDISSTESAGLFYVSPYTTALELAVVKRDPNPSDLELGERAAWGLRLQQAIAHGIGEDFGVQVRELAGYARYPELRMGASFDYEIHGLSNPKADNVIADMFRKHGPGVLEVKNVDSLVFKNTWDQTQEEVEAPPHIEIQLQHQLEVLQYNWGCLGVLVGGNRARAIVRERYLDVGAQIRDKVKWFWDLYDKHEMPPVRYPQDNKAIINLYQDVQPDKVFDARNDDVIMGLCDEYMAAHDRFKDAELAKETAKAKLLQRIVNAERVLVPGYSLSAGSVGPTRVEAYDRKGYRNFRLTRVKAKK